VSILADIFWEKVVAGRMLAAKAANDIQRASSVQMYRLIVFCPSLPICKTPQGKIRNKSNQPAHQEHSQQT